MKILFLASRFPYPLTQGDRLRAYHFLRLLSKRHEITLVVPIQTYGEYQALPLIKSYCHSVEVVPISIISRVLNLIKAPFLPLPWQVTFYEDRLIRQKVEHLLSQTSFDLVHTQLARMAPFTQPWKKTPKVLDFIDALSLNMDRRAKQERGILSWLFNSEAKRMQHYERKLINDFHQLFVCSPVDQKKIGDFKNLHVIPNGVDLADFPFVETKRCPNTIIFAGNMRYFPNINAAIYFIQEVLPRIRSVVPDVKLTVVGPNLPSERQNQFRQAGVTLTGFVPSVHEYLKKSAVAIAPMQSGSGIQNKVLEAMATGTPVVSSSYGIASLPVESGTHLLVANDSEEFAQSVIQLLSDHKLNHHIVTNAHHLVQQNFTWEQVEKILELTYEKAIEQFKNSMSSVQEN